MNSESFTRREFIVAGSAVAVAAVSTIIIKCDTIVNSDPFTGSRTFDLSKPEYAALTTIGGSAFCELNDPNFPAIVTRTGANEVKAFSSKCTHAGCKINLPDETVQAHCPCHGSVFNSSGNLISGPAKDQPTYSAVISENILTITG
jgi:cytochrome b6-f complex iron-sulfur subunit